MQVEQERYNKKIDEQKKQYESKMKNEQQMEQVRQKMKDISRALDEANEIARFMQKDIRFEKSIVSNFEDSNIYSGADFDMQTEVQVKVQDFATGSVSVWSCEKFNDKLAMMRDALNSYEQSEFRGQAPQDEDPFQVEAEPILLGQCFYMLEGLAYQMDNPRTIPIAATNNDICGELVMNVVPCDENGGEDLDEDQLTDDPKDLLNQTLDFKVQIEKIMNLVQDYSDVYCEYKFYMDETKYATITVEGKNGAPQFNYSHQHHVDCVTQFLLDYLCEDRLTIKIYGK